VRDVHKAQSIRGITTDKNKENKVVNTKLLKSTVIATCVIACALSLPGCSRENPMAKMDKNEISKILARASADSSRKQGTDDYIGQYDYEYCVKENKARIDCNILYSDMLAQLKKDKRLKDLTLNELKDEKFFNGIKEEFQAQAFITL